MSGHDYADDPSGTVMRAWRGRGIDWSRHGLGLVLIVLGWACAAWPDRAAPTSDEAMAIRRVMRNPWRVSARDLSRVEAARGQRMASLRPGTWRSDTQPGATQALAGRLQTRSLLMLCRNGHYRLQVTAYTRPPNFRPWQELARGSSAGTYGLQGHVLVFQRVRGDAGLLPVNAGVMIMQSTDDELVLDVGAGVRWTFVPVAQQCDA